MVYPFQGGDSAVGCVRFSAIKMSNEADVALPSFCSFHAEQAIAYGKSLFPIQRHMGDMRR